MKKKSSGGKLVPFELRTRLCELKGARLSVWFCHWLHSGKQGLSWPSLDLLAKETGLDKGWIVKARAWLRKNGWLVQELDEQPRQPNNRFAVARYFARIPPPMERKSATEKLRNGESPQGRGRDSRQGRGRDSLHRSTTVKKYRGSSPASRDGMNSFQELLKKLEAIYKHNRGITPTWMKKDYSALKKLREQPHVTDREIERRFGHYLEGGDAFCKKNGFSLGLFCSSRFDAFAKHPRRIPIVEPDY